MRVKLFLSLVLAVSGLLCTATPSEAQWRGRYWRGGYGNAFYPTYYYRQPTYYYYQQPTYYWTTPGVNIGIGLGGYYAPRYYYQPGFTYSYGTTYYPGTIYYP